MNDDLKQLIEISDENILMNFCIDDQEYVVLSDKEELEEDDNIYFAKLDKMDDINYIIRNIEDDQEYEKVVKVYDEIINGIGDDIDEEDV